MLKKIFFFISFFTCLLSEEQNLSNLSDFGGDPSGIVAGCVNVITGDFIVNRDDFVVKGYEPIHFPLHYSPNEVMNINKVYGGWDLAENYLTLTWTWRDDDSYYLKVYEKSGLCICHLYRRHQIKKEPKKAHSLPQFISIRGWTNTALGCLSARNNPTIITCL